MDLATLKEENQLEPGTLISQVFAPRYMTRSRVVSDSKSDVHSSSKHSVDESPVHLANEQSTKESLPAVSSEWETSSDTQAPGSETAVVDTPSGSSVGAVSSKRKRGRHKEYTAPTGVWKTNGGYISTIYVGNRRIYGPLRENPEEAGVDRQKLIEAKAFAKTEADMRSFIATLKTGGSLAPRPTAPERSVKRKRPLLTTCISSATIIVNTHEATPTSA